MVSPHIEELNLLHANICQALGDPKRIQILYTLHEQPLHVNALVDLLELPQSTVSRHLRVLRQRGIVETERDGTMITYRLSDPRIIRVLDSMRQILRDALSRQSRYLA